MITLEQLELVGSNLVELKMEGQKVYKKSGFGGLCLQENSVLLTK